jgi:hypothetical protein
MAAPVLAVSAQAQRISAVGMRMKDLSKWLDAERADAPLTRTGAAAKCLTAEARIEAGPSSQ